MNATILRRRNIKYLKKVRIKCYINFKQLLRLLSTAAPTSYTREYLTISTSPLWTAGHPYHPCGPPLMGFLWPHLQDHSLLRSRNSATMAMWRNDFSSLLCHWLIGNQNGSVFMIFSLNNNIIRVNILLLLLHCN